MLFAALRKVVPPSGAVCGGSVFRGGGVSMDYALRDGAGSVHGNDGIEILELPPRVHSDYESYVESVLSPREGDDSA